MSIRRFYLKYLLIPTVMPILAATAGAYSMAQEAENFSYYTATWAWGHVHEPTRDIIRHVMADGVMSRWESAEVNRAIMADAHMLMTCPVGEECRNKTVIEARAALMEVMK